MTANFLRITDGLDFPGLPSPPSNPAEGAVYYDTTMTKLRQYRNSAWQDLDSGSASELLETFKNLLISSSFNLMTPSVAALDGSTLISTYGGTATLDQGNKTYKFVNTSDSITTLQLLDTEEFINNFLDIWSVELATTWRNSYIDTAAIYEISRDGGGHWAALTASRVGLNGNTYISDYKWPREEEDTAYSVNTTGASYTALTNTAGTVESLAAKITFSAQSRGGSIRFKLSKNGSPSGNYRFAIFSDNSGLPGTRLYTTAWQAISSITGTPTDYEVSFIGDFFMSSGATYYAILETDDTYKTSYVATTTELRLSSDTTGTNLAFSLDGATWSAIASTTLVYQVKAYQESFVTQLSATTNNDETVLNATTQQKLSQAFTVTNVCVVKQIQIRVNVSGSPTGYMWLSIVKDNAGSPSDSPNDVLTESAAYNIASLSAGQQTISMSYPATSLPAGTYHLVLRTDAVYKAGTLGLYWRGNNVPVVAGKRNNGSAWSALSTPMTFMHYINGRVLDLRLRITSSAADKWLDAFAVLYDQEIGGVIGSSQLVSRSKFKAVADNLSSFTLPWIPDPDLVSAYHVETGQVYKFGAFTVQGATVNFATNFFYNGGVEADVTLVFQQVDATSYDNSDRNAALLAANNLGSTDPIIDKSNAGRGIFLRRPDGTLREVCLDDSDNIVVYSI